MLRQAWLRGGLGLGLCLSAGCLYHTTAPADVPRTEQVVQPPPANPPRAASAIEPPPEPFKVEMGPSPLPDLLMPPPGPKADKPPADRPLVAAMRRVLEKHPAEAAKELDRVDAPKRERLLALLKLTANVSEGDLEKLPPDEAEALLDHLRGVSRSLRELAPLQLRGVRYCRSIKGFGQYEAAGEPAFRIGASGQPGERVQVYAEVRHFRSKAHDGAHETKLSATLEVRGADGKAVATVPLGVCSDRSLSPRDDYFLNCQFHVPAGLAPGEYTLWLGVRDVGGGKPREARASLPFRVAG